MIQVPFAAMAWKNLLFPLEPPLVCIVLGSVALTCLIAGLSSTAPSWGILQAQGIPAVNGSPSFSLKNPFIGLEEPSISSSPSKSNTGFSNIFADMKPH